MADGPSQALNLGNAPQPYADSFFSLDLMKGAEHWTFYTENGTELNDPGTLAFDERGWLTALPVSDGAPTTAISNVFYGNILPAGQYIMEWQGQGDVSVNQTYTETGPNKILIDFGANYIDDDGNPRQDGITVILSNTDPNATGDYVHDIKLYKVENADLVAAGERFDPVWVDRVDDFRMLRTHDWQFTNFNTTTEWSRNVFSADQAVWGLEGRGMPYEVSVDLANEVRSDLWVNIPHTASDDYIRSAAEYLKENLDPDLRLQVEFSNEYFTTIFDQYAYFQNGGKANFGDAEFAAGEFYGTRAAHMKEIFDGVFGADSPRMQVVVTVDNVALNSGEALAVLSAPDSVANGGTSPLLAGVDVIATDGYLSWWVPAMEDEMRGWMMQPDGGFGAARDFLIEQFTTELLPSWQNGRALADANGLEFMVYEGGTLLLNGGDYANADPVFTDFAIRFTASQELRDVYAVMEAGWRTVGTGPFAWYNDTGRPGPWGDYGHWDSVTYAPDPRTDVITQANENVPAWWGGDDRPASTFDDGLYAAGDTGNNAMTGTQLADRLYGLAGNDRLWGKDGNDRLWSGDGNDIVSGGRGADEINGGAGRDLARYDGSSSGVTVNLQSGKGYRGEAAGDRLTGIENLLGSRYDDRLIGNDDGNRLVAGSGSDRVFGGKGADALIGGAGADVLFGGADNDAFIFRNARDAGDTIGDFGRGDDTFRLSAAAFGDMPRGVLSQSAFQSSNAATSNDAGVVVIYDRDDHRIFVDIDGPGGAAPILLANVQADAVITASDFIFF